MTQSIQDLVGEPIWRYFYALTQVPRPSHHETKIQQLMLLFAEQNALESERDEAGNIIIRKPATRGCASAPGLILQGHLDMVPQANEGSTHDFSNDPITTLVEGDWITADGTTLGADNGIGVAAAMALLASTDIKHGPLEGLFTANEEDGMTGAFAVRADQLSGQILLNMDSEEEGVLTVGCAGGVNVSGKIPIVLAPTETDDLSIQIKIRGLKGGHSGVDIHRGRGNANKALARLMQSVGETHDFRVAGFNGGSLRNAIPREATGGLLIKASDQDEVLQILSTTKAHLLEELRATEVEFSITMETGAPPSVALDAASSKKLVDLIQGIPHGVMRMSDDMPGLVESSTNLAIVKLQGDEAQIQCLVRSSVDTSRDELCRIHQGLFRLAGGTVVIDGAYPGWKPNLDSPVLKVMKSAHMSVFGREAEIGGIHAGLECGILGAPMPHLDMISFGPTIEYPHSPDERMNIPSVNRFWKLLVETVESLAELK